MGIETGIQNFFSAIFRREPPIPPTPEEARRLSQATGLAKLLGEIDVEILSVRPVIRDLLGPDGATQQEEAIELKTRSVMLKGKDEVYYATPEEIRATREWADLYRRTHDINSLDNLMQAEVTGSWVVIRLPQIERYLGGDLQRTLFP